MSNLDFYPTFKELLELEIPENKVLDGINLAGLLLEGEKPSERPLYFHFPVYLQAYDKNSGVNRDPLFRTRPGTAMRLGDWKLIYYYEDEKAELFNLKDDLSETTNLVNQYPEKYKELKAMMDDWLKRTNAPIPTEPNPGFDANWNKQQIEKYHKTKAS